MEEYKIIDRNPSMVWMNPIFLEDRLDGEFYSPNYISNEDKLLEFGNIKRLKDIYIKGNYGTLPNSNDYKKEGVLLIRGKDLKGLTVKPSEDIFVNEEYCSSKNTVEKEDILILIKGATIDNEWSVAIVNKKHEGSIFNGSIFRIKVKEKYDPFFITAFMSTKYFLKQKTRAISNTGIYYNNQKTIKNYKIPIPSAEIQKYIGDKVRKAEKLRGEAKTLREKAENELGKVLKSDSFSFNKQKYLFTNKVTERRIDAWYYKPIFERITDYLEEFTQVKKMNEVTKIGKGFSYSSNKELGNIPYLRISDINNYRFDIEESLGIPERIYNKREDKKLEKFDIVLAITGATIGKAAVVVKDDEKMTLSADTAYLRVTNQDEIYPLYLLTFLKTEFGQLQIKQGITGATNRHLGLEDIASIKVPIIDIDKQKSIHDKILKSIKNENKSKQLIEEAKQDVEDLIEGNLEIDN